MHALPFAAINIKANIVLCDAEDFFSIVYLMMLSVTQIIQHWGVQLFGNGPQPLLWVGS